MTMRPVAFSLLLATFALSETSASSADLSKIERTIAREPAYKGQPKYCLLVFGAEAKHRAWLVVDDEAVYVDRKGNGDLTDQGNRMPRVKGRQQKLGALDFDNGKARYTNLVLENDFRGYIIDVQGKYKQRGG